MAARENQGLQIALIIFVILTIILIVTTYMFFSSYSQERDRAKSMSDAKAAADSATQKAIAESEELKKLVTGDPATALDAVKEAATKDIQTNGDNPVEAQQNYHALVEMMAGKIRSLQEAETKLTADNAALNAQLATNQQAAQAEVAQYVEKLNATAADLEGERTKFGQDRTELTGQMEQLNTKFQSANAERERVAQQTSGQIASLSGELKQSEELLDRMRNEKEIDAKANEYPDGKVTRVNQRTRLVWLNVGTADGLRTQTSFVVVAPEDGNPVKSKPKASIQVVRLTAEHQAEAKIVEDDLSNPILPGDLIFSTVWDAGQPEHFALVGAMDINDDGTDDTQLVHDLITLNGGVIDAEVVDGKKTGTMSLNTKYLVMGKRPGAEGTSPAEGDLAAFSEMMSEAEKLGVKTIAVSEFLDYMGYEGQERTVNLGKAANPADFKPRLPAGTQRTIRGSGQPDEYRRTREGNLHD
jgi:uncharacterized protein (UPF0333 family)